VPAGHTKIEGTVRYLGIEVDDALAIAEQVDVWCTRAERTCSAPPHRPVRAQPVWKRENAWSR